MKIAKNWCSLTIALLLLTLALSQPACRREEEPLDKNRPPETYLTVAPPETLDSNYRVHLFWHGEDRDGLVTKFIFHISDTVNTLKPYEERELEILDWNPAERKDDYESALFTTKTDTVILFRGYDEETGNLRKKQAFHIAAVDDGGLIDPSPARIQFFATTSALPTVRYWIKVGDEPFTEYNPSILDTIPLFKALRIRFRGENANSGILSYQWSYNDQDFPDSNNDGFPEWYIPEPFEIIEVGPLNNRPDSLLNSGDFYFRGIVRDSAGAISEVDFQTGEGLCHLVINFDPNTEILSGDNYFRDEFGNIDSSTVDFNDGIPDTLPFGSWVRINYRGYDDPRDSLEVYPPVHIRYKYMLEYSALARNNKVMSVRTPLFPLIGNAEYTNPGEIDSTTMTVGSCYYTFRVQSYDEQYRYDHTPARVSFYGNFQPTVDDLTLGMLYGTYFLPFQGDTVYLGDPMDDTNWNTPAIGDTVYPLEVIRGGERVGFEYKFTLRATGHDDPRDLPGSAIRSWYFWITGSGEDLNFTGERTDIFPDTDNELTQTIRISLPLDDQTGYPDSTFCAELPSYLGRQDFSIIGYDMGRIVDYTQKIRQQSPLFDDNWNIIRPGEMYESTSNVANYARKDTLSGSFGIKPLW